MIEDFSNPGLPPQLKHVGAVGGVMSTTVGPLRPYGGPRVRIPSSSGESIANLPFQGFKTAGWGESRPDIACFIYPSWIKLS
jgi:hypothetical protein